MSELEIKEISSKYIGRTYYALDFLKKSKIAETVNTCVKNNEYYVKTEDGGVVCFTAGQLFEIMILNRLEGLKTPIYQIGSWCANTAIPEIYGVPASLLNDDRIGRFLDQISENIATIDSQITLNIVKEYDLEISQIHFDPSSFNVHGDYLPIAGEQAPIRITYGRNGQGKKDEKQVRFGLAITEDGGFPLMAKGYSGNTNDSQMHPEFLAQLREMLGTTDFLFIADTKMDTKENIMDIMDKDGFFVCPGALNVKIKREYLEKYSHENRFERLEYLSKAEKKRSKKQRRYYKAFERIEELVIKKRGEAEKKYCYRQIFVYSPIKANANAKGRKKNISKVEKELNYLASRLNKKGYHTRDKIAQKLNAILKRAGGKFFDVQIHEKNKLFTISIFIKQDTIEQAERLDGIYTLKSNLPKEHYSINDILSLYKKQSRIETRIAALKGPLQLAPIYLKTPERILALFMIIVQTLKIFTLIEREVHRAVEHREMAIPILPENRLSEKPKASSILRVFDEHHISLISVFFVDGSSKTYLTNLSQKQRMLFDFIKRTPPDRRTFSRKVGVYKILQRFR